MNCIIKQQNEIEAQKWNEFVKANSMGWAYFLYELIGVHRNSLFKNKSFAIVDQDNNDEILFVQQLHLCVHRPVQKAYLIKERKLVSQWGYVLKDNLARKQFRSVKECYEKYIDSYIKDNKIHKFNIALPPLTQANLENKTAVNPLMVLNFKPTVRYTYIVDFSKPDDRMLADCEETTRQAIRKLDAADKYIVEECKPTEEDCQIYINLHKETYTRTNDKTGIIADEYHHHMFFELLPKGICRIFFLREKETNEVVATVSILIYNKTAYYWWGDSKNEKEIGVNKYLLFKVMLIIRESFEKTGFFETGGAYPYLRNGKYKGLNDFKKCFGTFLFPIWEGAYEMPSSSFKLTVKKLLQRG